MMARVRTYQRGLRESLLLVGVDRAAHSIALPGVDTPLGFDHME
jgi:hypothetical protein